jgi:hypothetical protein
MYVISEQLVPKQCHVVRLNEIAGSGVADLVSETACVLTQHASFRR